MLTFSTICDDFVKAQGFVAHECQSDEEARKEAAALDTTALDSGLSFTTEYPVVYFNSETTGEKAYEEFYVLGENIDMQRFISLGVVNQSTRHDLDEMNNFFDKLETIFRKDDFTKAEVVDAIKEFLPNFQHEEKGVNLDQKM
jgi:hypothetical protein